MDSKPHLTRIVSEVAWALTKFAESEKWEKSDYWIYYYENSDWDYVHFIFVSRHFDHDDERASFSRVWQYLVNYFRDDPDILRPVTLIVSSKAETESGGLHSIGSQFQEYWTPAPVSQTT